MIKINSIEKKEGDNYFVVYKKHGEIFTYSGSREEIKKEISNLYGYKELMLVLEPKVWLILNLSMVLENVESQLIEKF